MLYKTTWRNQHTQNRKLKMNIKNFITELTQESSSFPEPIVSVDLQSHLQQITHILPQLGRAFKCLKSSDNKFPDLSACWELPLLQLVQHAQAYWVTIILHRGVIISYRERHCRTVVYQVITNSASEVFTGGLQSFTIIKY